MVETTDLSKTFGPVLPAKRASARARMRPENRPSLDSPDSRPVFINLFHY